MSKFLKAMYKYGDTSVLNDPGTMRRIAVYVTGALDLHLLDHTLM